MPPVDEQARLAALRRYRILDTDPEQAFDDLTMLASHICGTPMALITLIDEDRQWFKSEVGVGIRQTERSIAFCTHAITQPGIMEVPDAREDERFRHNPIVVGEPHIRFYAGRAAGHAGRSRAGHAVRGGHQAAAAHRRTDAGARGAAPAGPGAAGASLQPDGVGSRRSPERDRAEVEQMALVAGLRASLEKVDKLSALMPFTSTCEMNLVLLAMPVVDSRP